MYYITTNVRIPKNEYEDLKNFAFLQKKSIASVIREALKEYKSKRITSRSKKMKLYNLIAKSRIKINVSTTELVKEGRKFE